MTLFWVGNGNIVGLCHTVLLYLFCLQIDLLVRYQRYQEERIRQMQATSDAVQKRKKLKPNKFIGRVQWSYFVFDFVCAVLTLCN